MYVWIELFEIEWPGPVYRRGPKWFSSKYSYHRYKIETFIIEKMRLLLVYKRNTYTAIRLYGYKTNEKTISFFHFLFHTRKFYRMKINSRPFCRYLSNQINRSQINFEVDVLLTIKYIRRCQMGPLTMYTISQYNLSSSWNTAL